MVGRIHSILLATSVNLGIFSFRPEKLKPRHVSVQTRLKLEPTLKLTHCLNSRYFELL